MKTKTTYVVGCLDDRFLLDAKMTVYIYKGDRNAMCDYKDRNHWTLDRCVCKEYEEFIKITGECETDSSFWFGCLESKLRYLKEKIEGNQRYENLIEN